MKDEKHTCPVPLKNDNWSDVSCNRELKSFLNKYSRTKKKKRLHWTPKRRRGFEKRQSASHLLFCSLLFIFDWLQNKQEHINTHSNIKWNRLIISRGYEIEAFYFYFPQLYQEFILSARHSRGLEIKATELDTSVAFLWNSIDLNNGLEEHDLSLNF